MYFIQVSKSLMKIAVTVSQFDIAIWSLFTSQIAAIFVINLLLNEKNFQNQVQYVEMTSYSSFSDVSEQSETNPITPPIITNI